MFIMYMSCWCFINAVNGAVLDPGLFLSPLPPLMQTSQDLSPGILWAKPVDTTVHTGSIEKSNPALDKNPTKDKAYEESMVKAETFWPSFHTPGRVAGSIHIPLTFTVSGTYGKKGPSAGVISSSYASMSGGGLFGGYGKAGLAGSGYGTYGSAVPKVRIFGGNTGSTWSGWGNGKWGHYGKG